MEVATMVLLTAPMGDHGGLKLLLLSPRVLQSG